MAKTILSVDNTENSGEDETVSTNTASTLDNDEQLFHYYNGFDQDVTVTIVGSRAGDANFSESVQLSSETLTAGGSPGYFVLSDPWESLQITASPAADPTAGEFVVYRTDNN